MTTATTTPAGAGTMTMTTATTIPAGAGTTTERRVAGTGSPFALGLPRDLRQTSRKREAPRCRSRWRPAIMPMPRMISITVNT